MDDREYLGHIRKAILEVKAHTTGMSEQAYKADSKTQRAVERNLEIIGEATHNLSAALKGAHPDIEWDRIYGARNRLVHFYFGVDQTLLWTIVQQHLDPLLAKVEELLGREGEDA